MKYINPILLTFLTIFFFKISVNAQEQCQEFQKTIKDKEKIINKQQNDISEFKKELTQKEIEIQKINKEILYYKETLSLLSSKVSTTDKDVDFKINKVIGNSNTGKVIIEGILVNKGVLRSIQKKSAEVYEPKGNVSTTYEIGFGEKIRIEKLYKDTPVKFNIEIDQIVEGTPMIKTLIIDFHSNVGYRSDRLNPVFKNLKVEWK